MTMPRIHPERWARREHARTAADLHGPRISEGDHVETDDGAPLVALDYDAEHGGWWVEAPNGDQFLTTARLWKIP